MQNKFHNQEGVVLLVTVMIILAVTLLTSLTVSMGGINELDLGFSQDQSQRALQIADSCAEDAYFRVKKNPGFTTGSITLAEGNCTISIVPSGATRSITATGVFRDYTRDVFAETAVTTNGAGNAKGLTISQWNE